MRKKTIYEAPEAELLVVRFEGNFCATTESGTMPDDDYDDQGDFE